MTKELEAKMDKELLDKKLENSKNENENPR